MSRCFTLVLLAIAGTILFWAGSDRFESNGPNLLPADSGAYVTHRGKPVVGHPADADEGIRFRLDAGEAVEYRLKAPPAGQFLRLSGKIRTRGVELGDTRWNRARVFLISLGRDGKMIDATHEACGFQGDTDWTDCDQVFHIPVGAETLVFRISQGGRAGTMEMESPVVTAARVKGWHGIVSNGLLLGWLAITILCVANTGLSRLPFGWAILPLCIGILIGATAPELLVERMVSEGTDLYEQAREHLSVASKPETGAPLPQEAVKSKKVTGYAGVSVHDVKRAGHILLFASLGGVSLLSLLSRRKGAPGIRSLAIAVLSISLFAASTEVLQMLMPSRGPTFQDLTADLVSAFSGMVVGWIGFRLFGLRNRGDL